MEVPDYEILGQTELELGGRVLWAIDLGVEEDYRVVGLVTENSVNFACIPVNETRASDGGLSLEVLARHSLPNPTAWASATPDSEFLLVALRDGSVAFYSRKGYKVFSQTLPLKQGEAITYIGCEHIGAEEMIVWIGLSSNTLVVLSRVSLPLLREASEQESSSELLGQILKGTKVTFKQLSLPRDKHEWLEATLLSPGKPESHLLVLFRSGAVAMATRVYSQDVIALEECRMASFPGIVPECVDLMAFEEASTDIPVVIVGGIRDTRLQALDLQKNSWHVLQSPIPAEVQFERFFSVFNEGDDSAWHGCLWRASDHTRLLVTRLVEEEATVSVCCNLVGAVSVPLPNGEDLVSSSSPSFASWFVMLNPLGGSSEEEEEEAEQKSQSENDSPGAVGSDQTIHVSLLKALSSVEKLESLVRMKRIDNAHAYARKIGASPQDVARAQAIVLSREINRLEGDTEDDEGAMRAMPMMEDLVSLLRQLRGDAEFVVDIVVSTDAKQASSQRKLLLSGWESLYATGKQLGAGHTMVGDIGSLLGSDGSSLLATSMGLDVSGDASERLSSLISLLADGSARRVVSQLVAKPEIPTLLESGAESSSCSLPQQLDWLQLFFQFLAVGNARAAWLVASSLGRTFDIKDLPPEDKLLGIPLHQESFRVLFGTVGQFCPEGVSWLGGLLSRLIASCENSDELSVLRSIIVLFLRIPLLPSSRGETQFASTLDIAACDMNAFAAVGFTPQLGRLLPSGSLFDGFASKDHKDADSRANGADGVMERSTLDDSFESLSLRLSHFFADSVFSQSLPHIDPSVELKDGALYLQLDLCWLSLGIAELQFLRSAFELELSLEDLAQDSPAGICVALMDRESKSEVGMTDLTLYMA